MKSQKINPYLPPTRVAVMIAMLAAMLTAIFGLMTASWLFGAVLGLSFAAAFYFVVVVNARRAAAKPKRNR